MLQWLERLADQLSRAAKDGTPPPTAPAAVVGPALVLRMPARAEQLRQRLDLAAACRWSDLRDAVDRDCRPTARRRVGKDPAERAREFMAEGAVSRALRALDTTPTDATLTPEDAALAMRPLFPPEVRAGLDARLCATPSPPTFRPPVGDVAGATSPLAEALGWGAACHSQCRRAMAGPPSEHAETGDSVATTGQTRWRRAVLGALAAAGRCAQPGPSGLRAEHVREALAYKPLHERITSALELVVDLLCSGVVPAAMRDTRLFAIPKPGGAGVRPVGACELLRNLAARVALPALSRQLAAQDAPLGQYGAAQFGTQRVASCVHAAVRSNMHVLSLDLRNAFNSVSRRAVLAAVPTDNPAFPLTHALYNGPLWMRSPSRSAPPLESQAGVIQGCPLAAVLFAHTLITGPVARAREDVASHAVRACPAPPCPSPADESAELPRELRRQARGERVFDAWYADDGFLLSHSLDAINRLAAAIATRCRDIGLEVATGVGKTKLLTASHDTTVPPGSWLHTNSSRADMLTCLGVPCSRPGDRAAATAIAQSVADICEDVRGIERLRDPQHIVQALAVAGTWSRAHHIISLAPATSLDMTTLTNELDRADLQVLRSALHPHIVRDDDAVALRQASLPLSLGGLGIKSASREITRARAAAATQLAAVSRNDTAAASAARAELREARAKDDLQLAKQLRGPAPTTRTPHDTLRTRARLMELAAEGGRHTAAWLRGAISEANGTLISNPDVAATALALRLGLDVFGGAVPAGGTRCPVACRTREQHMDAQGSHTLGCSACTTARHDRIKYRLHAVLVGDGGVTPPTYDGCPRGGLPRECILLEAHCGPNGDPLIASRRDRDGDIAVTLPGSGEKWSYIDICARSHRLDILPKAAADGTAAAASAYAEKARRIATVRARGADLIPLGVGPYGHIDRRSAASTRKIATAADDLDPVGPHGPLMGRPARALAAIATAAVAGGAYGVLRVREALGIAAVAATGA